MSTYSNWATGWKILLGVLTGGMANVLLKTQDNFLGAVAETNQRRRESEKEFEKSLVDSENYSESDIVSDVADAYNSSSDNPYLAYRNNSSMPNFASDVDDPWSSWINSKTGAGLTQNEKIKMAYQTWERQQAQNYNHNEAVDARMYEMYMAQNKYQMETQSMVDAGINPAMAYGGGSLVPTHATGAMGSSSPQSAPAAPTTGSLLGLVDVLSTVMRMPLEMKKLNAEINSINAGTGKVKSETRAIDAKLPFEVDNLKAQVRSSNLSSDAQEIINSYLDKQQEAELRMKNASVDEVEQRIQVMVKEIEKMDYEELTMTISWMETQEKIFNLQKQRELTETQMKELESLIRVNNANASKIGLDVSNYEDIQVVGTASSSMRFGPFAVQEGEPITLGMIKAAREAQKAEKEKEKHPKSMKEIKEEYPE